MRNLYVTTFWVALAAACPLSAHAGDAAPIRGTLDHDDGKPKRVITSNLTHYPFRKTHHHVQGGSFNYRSTIDQANRSFIDLVNQKSILTASLPVQSFILRNAIDDGTDQQYLGNYLISALEYDPTLAASAHEIAARRAERQSAYFDLLPRINLSASVSARANSIHASSDQIDNFLTSSINAEWTIFASGGLKAGIDASHSRELAAKMSFLNAERNKLYEHAAVYIRYAASKEQTKILGKTASRLRQVRNTVKKQFDAGFASRTDIALVEAELATLDLQVENSRHSQKELKVEWQRRAGASGQNIKVHLPKPANLIPENQNTAINRAIASHPAIAAAEHAARAEEAQSRLTRSSFLPRITAYASLDHTNDSIGIPDYSQDVNWQAGIRLNVPIVNLPATAQYRAAKSRSIAARFRAIDTRQQIATQIKTSWIAYENQRKSTSILQRKKNAQHRAVKGYRKEVNAGLRGVTDLLRAEMNYTRVELEILQARMQLLEATYAIAINLPDMTIARLSGK